MSVEEYKTHYIVNGGGRVVAITGEIEEVKERVKGGTRTGNVYHGPGAPVLEKAHKGLGGFRMATKDEAEACKKADEKAGAEDRKRMEEAAAKREEASIAFDMAKQARKAAEGTKSYQTATYAKEEKDAKPSK